MANGVFNIAKGKVKYYAELGAAADALVVVLLQANEAEATLVDYDDLGALIAAAGNTEATFTNYARKSLTAATIDVDDTNNWLDVDIADQTWTAAGGATNNTLTKLLICYDGDTAAGTDANIIPLTHHDFAVTTDGSDLTAQIATEGFYRAS